MSRIEGTNTEVRTDTMAKAIIIDLTDEPSVQADEVIRYLESGSLALRTRKKLCNIAQRVSESGTVLILRFQGAWEFFVELDIRDALSKLFKQKQPLCV